MFSSLDLELTLDQKYLFILISVTEIWLQLVVRTNVLGYFMLLQAQIYL